jgi:hypothetical protein
VLDRITSAATNMTQPLTPHVPLDMGDMMQSALFIRIFSKFIFREVTLLQIPFLGRKGLCILQKNITLERIRAMLQMRGPAAVNDERRACDVICVV